jgi:putative colanic acid biosynthesis glycosyltransferase
MRASAPDISIVTVVRNDRDGLRATEESIIRQTSRDYEWVVVDGGSRDGTVEAIRSSRVERIGWVSEPDRGIYDAMNKGTRMSTGRYVVFLNAGDTFADESVIEKVVRSISRTTMNEGPAPIIMGGANFVLPEGETVPRRPREAGYMWHSLPTVHQSMFFPTGFVVRNPYDISYRVCGDYYLGALAHKHGLEFVVVDYPIVDFQVGGLSYQRPFQLMREAARVQRTVLGMGYSRVCISALRRTANMLGLRALAKLRRRKPHRLAAPAIGTGE